MAFFRKSDDPYTKALKRGFEDAKLLTKLNQEQKEQELATRKELQYEKIN